MSAIIPNETKIFIPLNPPWIRKSLKNMLNNRKNRLFKNYKKHSYKVEDKIRLDTFLIECKHAVKTAKLSYLTNLENKEYDHNTNRKFY